MALARDTVVFTGSWIPDHELARLRGTQIDPQHLGPVVDSGLRTTADGVFGAGNLLHPVDTADVAALDGRHVARRVEQYLDSGDQRRPAVRLRAEPPFPRSRRRHDRPVPARTGALSPPGPAGLRGLAVAGLAA